MQDTKKFHLLRMKVTGNFSQTVAFEAGLTALPETSYEILPEDIESIFDYYGPVDLDFIATTTVAVVTVAAGLAAIAQLLLECTRKEGEKEVVVHIGSTEIKIKGNMPEDEIVSVLQNAATIVSREKGKRIITNEKKKKHLQILTSQRGRMKAMIKHYESRIKAEPKRGRQDRKHQEADKQILARLKRELTRLNREIRKAQIKSE
jgi:hypothetical protein